MLLWDQRGTLKHVGEYVTRVPVGNGVCKLFSHGNALRGNISDCLLTISQFLDGSLHEKNDSSQYVMLFMDLAHSVSIVNASSSDQDVPDVLWSEEPNPRVIACILALADRLARLQRPVLVVLGSPSMGSTSFPAQRYARAVAHCFSCRGVLAVFPTVFWKRIESLGIVPLVGGNALVAIPLATVEVVREWKRWMQKLASLARSIFVPCETKLATGFMSTYQNRGGRVLLSQAPLGSPPPDVGASNCLAISALRSQAAFADFNSALRQARQHGCVYPCEQKVHSTFERVRTRESGTHEEALGRRPYSYGWMS